MLLSIRQVISFLLLASSTPPTSASLAPNSSYEPDLATARCNAFRIFNTVHSAMRQWGSTINHNGVSFFLATVPEGNLFYHGRPSPDRPDSFDWLAFEVEQAYGFALSGMPPPHQPHPPDKPDMLSWQPSHSEVKKTQVPQTHGLRFAEGSNAQHRLVDDDDRGKHNPPLPSRGYFLTYRATRQLKLVYIDGMSAGKGSWGNTDSQDLLITGHPRNFTNDPDFGGMLCSLAKEWGIDGWVRMETGFEIIYCDFSPGAELEFVSQHGSAFPNETAGNREWDIKTLLFEALRAASQRYNGFGRARIEVDWGSMVSVFAYDVNITNPDLKRQDLPRLVGLTRGEAEGIRGRLGEVVAARKEGGMPTVDWQGVVDEIVTRFSDRLHFIAHGNLSAEVLSGEVGTLINPFLDYPADMNASTPSPASIMLCTRYCLDAALLRKDTWTPGHQRMLRFSSR